MSGHGMLIGITIITLLLVVVILGILLYRGGHSVETAEIIKHVEEVKTKMDESRNQLGVMGMKQDSHNRAISSWIKVLLDRFGFLTAKNKQPKTDVREDKHRD